MTTGLFYGDGMCNGIYIKTSFDFDSGSTFYKGYIKDGMSHGLGQMVTKLGSFIGEF